MLLDRFDWLEFDSLIRMLHFERTVLFHQRMNFAQEVDRLVTELGYDRVHFIFAGEVPQDVQLLIKMTLLVLF